MHRSSRPDVLDLQHSKSFLTRSRSRSIGSTDNALSSATSSTHSSSPLTSVSREPAYIAASAATGIVTSDHKDFLESLQDQGFIKSGPQTILVTPPPLRLVNQFLDFLLYSFLSSSKSTSLPALRPAVEEVLRSRMAKEALAGADYEVQSYLGSEDEEALGTLQDGRESNAEWDLEGTWRRTRLRCMIYSSLGDLEEDDEDAYDEFGHLEGTVGFQQYHKNSGTPGVASPAVAIWLTAILEYIGEQTLLVAGHATIARYAAQRIAAAKSEDGTQVTSKFVERLAVEELDVEKVALNPSLGRMWRQWRKCVRNARGSFSATSWEVALHQGVLQRLERQASVTSWESIGTPSDGSDRFPVAEPPRSRDGAVVANNDLLDEEECTDEPNAVEENSACSEFGERVKEGPLTPIVETASPVHEHPGENTKQAMVTVEADNNMLLAPDSLMNPGNRRPQSLILLPCTTEPPFILPSRSETLRRPRSLPALERGDFPDPVTEGDMEKAHMNMSGCKSGRPSTYAEEGSKILRSVTSDRVENIPPWNEEGRTNPAGEVDQEPVAVCSGALTSEEVLNREVDILEAVDYPKVDCENDSAFQNTPVGQDVQSATGVARTSDDFVTPQKRLAPSQHERRKESRKISANRQSSKLGGSEGEAAEPIETVLAECDDGDKAAKTIGASQLSDSVKILPSIHEHGLYTREEQIKRVSGPPSTTNLREMVESAATSSDDDSSIAASHKELLVTTHSEIMQSSHSKQLSTASSKHSQLSDRKAGQSASGHPSSSSLSISSDHGTGVRVLTPPATPNKLRRSSSFSKMVRPTHTSSSSASQSSVKLKTFMTWPTETGKYGKVQDSDDDSKGSLYSEKHAQRLTSMEDKERSFEELISSGGTIHCTLTPDPIRNMESSRRTPTSELADFLRNTSPDGLVSRTSNKRPSPSRLASSSSSRRVEDVSIPPRSFSPQSQTTFSKRHRNVASVSGSTITTPRPKHIPLTSVGITGIPRVLTHQREEPQPSGSRKLVARDASGSTGGDSTSALADFFRNTIPPVDGEQVVTHRISRSVAPFRNTMDSTHFGADSLCDPKESDAIEPFNNDSAISSALPESYQSSFSSSTALLRSNSRKGRDYGSTGSLRKQSRVKDPYAIDMDDLDDDDLEALDLVLPPKKNTEESLTDFLRSVPPPFAEPPEDSSKSVQKKNSSVSLISRFGRSSTRKNSISSNGGDRIPPMSSVPTTKYIPIPIVPETTDQMSPTQESLSMTPSSFRTDFDSMVVPRSSSFQQSRNFQQARGPRADSNRTDSLADFLKSSEPQRPRSPPSKEESGLAKLKIAFSRKQKRNELAGVV